MRRLATCAFALAAGLVLGSAALMTAGAQTGDGWVTLLDSSKMGEWDRVGESNWRMEDGAVVADKRSGDSPAYLVTKGPYKDFQIHAEFWASDDANSGIFLRCANPKQIGDRSCYEVNIFDQRPDPTYGTGGIVHFAEVNPMPKAGGKWNTFEITAKGRNIVVKLNGKETANLQSGMFEQGHFTLQYGAGTVKFRKVAVKPL